MKPTPPGWPRISVSLYYEDPHEAIDWLCRAFGFEVRIKVLTEDGRVRHSELTYGEGVIMVSDGKGRESVAFRKSPRQCGGANTQNIMIYVDDVEAHHARAVAAGAKVDVALVTNDHGPEYWADRSYGVLDYEGHHWWFCQRVR